MGGCPADAHRIDASELCFDTAFLVMEYCGRGALMETEQLPTTPIMRDVAKRAFADIVVGLEHVHAKGIAHNDVTPGAQRDAHELHKSYTRVDGYTETCLRVPAHSRHSNAC